jgi:hypothetical protein
MRLFLIAPLAVLLSTAAFAQAPAVAPAPAPVAAPVPNPNAPVTAVAVELTPEQDAIIYREATMTPAERAQIPIRLGDMVPLTVKTALVPDSLGIEKAKGLWYTVVPSLHDGQTFHDVILIDGNHKVVRIIPGH